MQDRGVNRPKRTPPRLAAARGPRARVGVPMLVAVQRSDQGALGPSRTRPTVAPLPRLIVQHLPTHPNKRHLLRLLGSLILTLGLTVVTKMFISSKKSLSFL